MCAFFIHFKNHNSWLVFSTFGVYQVYLLLQEFKWMFSYFFASSKIPRSQRRPRVLQRRAISVARNSLRNPRTKRSGALNARSKNAFLCSQRRSDQRCLKNAAAGKIRRASWRSFEITKSAKKLSVFSVSVESVALKNLLTSIVFSALLSGSKKNLHATKIFWIPFDQYTFH